jgi:hypothetical protein
MLRAVRTMSLSGNALPDPRRAQVSKARPK